MTCELRRHLDSVPSETPIWDIVDRCRVWESHADSDVRRISKPGPDRAFPTYVVSYSERGTDDRRVAAVTTSQTTPDQLETLLRRLLAGPAVPALPPKPEPLTVEQLLQCLLAGIQVQKPTPAVAWEFRYCDLAAKPASRESGASDATSTGSHAT